MIIMLPIHWYCDRHIKNKCYNCSLENSKSFNALIYTSQAGQHKCKSCGCNYTVEKINYSNDISE